MTSDVLGVVDLFCGCGGFSEGFRLAGFEVLGGADLDEYRVLTCRLGDVVGRVGVGGLLDYRGFLRGELGLDEFLVEYGDVCGDFRVMDLCGGEFGVDGVVDGVIGGFPCQPFSRVGRAKICDPDGDGRVGLYRVFLDYVERLRPLFFVAENVPGFRSAGGGRVFRDFVGRAEGLGYGVVDVVLDASDFMVPQGRRRCFVLGFVDGVPDGLCFGGEAWDGLLWDVFMDLPVIEAGFRDEGFLEYCGPSSEVLVRAGIGGSIVGGVRNHVCRGHNVRDLGVFRFVADEWYRRGVNVSQYDIPGDLWVNDGSGRFRDLFRVLGGDKRVGHTVLANLSRDGRRFIHPLGGRSVSVREAARLQGFCDDYFFVGPMTRCYGMIGDAVPPGLGCGVARGVLDVIG
ncbi:MAG TPA: DNA cytosine methyltransferase [Candidatus Hydrothermia bacterium]|nr:DNA cytosine methyltransferase [Candidatus Hydrothermia bacterium]